MYMQGCCDVNAINGNNQTSLHIAASEGYTRVIEYLLVHCSADCSVADADGNTPLTLVITNKTTVKNPSEDSPLTLEVLLHNMLQ